MNSHAHVILELLAPKKVSSGISTCPLLPAARIFHVRPGLGIVSWPPIRRRIDVVPVLFSLHRLAAPLYRYIALALHSSPCPSKFKSRWSSLQYEREREREEDFEDLNTLPCRVRVVFNLF